MIAQRHPTSGEVIEVADACEAIIAQAPYPAVVANPILHFQSAHPNVLKRYSTIWESNQPPHRIRERLHSLARWWINALAPEEPLWAGETLPAKADIVFVSHYLGPQSDSSDGDLYFGSLPSELATAGVSSVAAYINHSGRSSREVATSWRLQSTPKVVLSRRLDASTEAEIARRLDSASTLIGPPTGSGRVEDQLRTIAAATQSEEPSRVAMRIGAQVGELVKLLQPSVLVTTYEGHSWERLAFKSAHDTKDGIVCVGYNHAVVLPCQRALAARLSGGYDPDIILTAGDVMRDRLAEVPQLAEVPIETLGSVRSRSPSNARASLTKRCLVLPEGILGESALLSSFAVEAANRRPDIQFRIRLHPTLNRSDLLSAEPRLRHLPPNVEWSSATLGEDISDAQWAIYRGSSTVIQAIQGGLQPFYLETPDEVFNLDPIAGLHGWRIRVADVSALLTGMAAEPDDSELKKAQAFCMEYFRPMNASVLASIVRAHSWTSSR